MYLRIQQRAQLLYIFINNLYKFAEKHATYLYNFVYLVKLQYKLPLNCFYLCIYLYIKNK